MTDHSRQDHAPDVTSLRDHSDTSHRLHDAQSADQEPRESDAEARRRARREFDVEAFFENMPV